jgi:hypothetical protein
VYIIEGSGAGRPLELRGYVGLFGRRWVPEGSAAAVVRPPGAKHWKYLPLDRIRSWQPLGGRTKAQLCLPFHCAQAAYHQALAREASAAGQTDEARQHRHDAEAFQAVVDELVGPSALDRLLGIDAD